jgi:hypothetical protein
MMFTTHTSDPTDARGAVIGGVIGCLFVFLALFAATKLMPPPQLEGTARLTQQDYVVTPVLRADRS